MKKLGFVTVNFNSWKQMKILLENIKRYNCLDRIIVIDNNSTDNSVEELKKIKNDKIVILEMNEKLTYSKALNMGAKYLIKEFDDCNIIFSDINIIIHKQEDLEKLSSDIDKHSIGLVMPNIVENRKLKRGKMISTIEDEIKSNIPIIGKHYIKKLEYDDRHYNESLSIIGVASNILFCMNSSVLKRINYFDENVSYYYQQNIISKKLEDIYKQIAVDNEIVVVHEYQYNANSTRINKYKEEKKCQRYFLEKYLLANEKELKKLDIYRKISLVLLYIKCFFKKK